MPLRKPAPWDESQYCIDEENKIFWLLGSWSRAMALAHKPGHAESVPGYTIKLCTKDELENIRKEINDEQENDYTESYRSFDR